MASVARIGIVGLVVLAAIAAGVAWRLQEEFRADLLRARQRLADGSRVVATACGPIEVAEAGEGPALLVVHGSGGGYDQGLALGADHAARGWRVIAPSRFGYLRTPWPQAEGIDIGKAQADAFACLLDVLGIRAVTVMGVSAGAISATEFAARHPLRTRALILMVPAGHRPEATPAMPAWAQWTMEAFIASDLPFWLASRLAPGLVRRLVLATPPAVYADASAEERRRADRIQAAILPISARRRGLMHDTLATQHVPRPDFEAIRAPTLVIAARDDGFGTFASASHAARHIPGARLLAFERGGHLLLDHQVEVVEAVYLFGLPMRERN